MVRPSRGSTSFVWQLLSLIFSAVEVIFKFKTLSIIWPINWLICDPEQEAGKHVAVFIDNFPIAPVVIPNISPGETVRKQYFPRIVLD